VSMSVSLNSRIEAPRQLELMFGCQLALTAHHHDVPGEHRALELRKLVSDSAARSQASISAPKSTRDPAGAVSGRIRSREVGETNAVLGRADMLPQHHAWGFRPHFAAQNSAATFCI
jgi:hypothetical protein